MTVARLHKAQLGVTLVLYGAALTTLILFLALFLPLVGKMADVPSLRDFSSIVPYLIIAMAVLDIAGKSFCLPISKDAHSRAVVWTALVCDLAAIVVALLPKVVSGAWPEPVQFVPGVLVALALVLFLLFLERLAKFIENAELADTASIVAQLGVGVVCMMGAMSLGVIDWDTIKFPAIKYASVLFTLVAVGLGGFSAVWCLRLLVNMKAAIVASEEKVWDEPMEAHEDEAEHGEAAENEEAAEHAAVGTAGEGAEHEASAEHLAAGEPTGHVGHGDAYEDVHAVDHMHEHAPAETAHAGEHAEAEHPAEHLAEHAEHHEPLEGLESLDFADHEEPT